MIIETMTQTEALEIVQKEAESMGIGILETFQLFRRHPEEFGSVERCAFNTALRGFQRLLAPVTE